MSLRGIAEETSLGFATVRTITGKSSGTDRARAKLDKLDAALAQTSTSRQDAALFAEMLSLPNDGRYPGIDLAPEQRRQRTLEAQTTQVAKLASQRPVLMIFEDAHWTDPTSLETFGRVVEGIRRLPVLLIVTFRSDFDAPWIGRPHVTFMAINRLGGARHRRHDRRRRRQQASPGKHPAGQHRTYRWHSPVCRGDDQGGARGRE
jgi:predicted ATPase